jgi:hypothetical protein
MLLIVGNEIAPISLGQTLYASGIVIGGSIITAFIFGNIARVMSELNKVDEHFENEKDRI